MLCEHCNYNEANVKYTQIVNGEKKEMFLCDKCAKEMGIDTLNFDMPIHLSNFFDDILNDYDGTNFSTNLLGTQQLKCNQCQMTYEEFRQNGKMGCANCYEAFSDKIEPLIKRLQGSTNHLGRKSKNIVEPKGIHTNKNTKLEDVEKLKEKIKQLIKEENYEEAAKIRDEIKKIENEK